MNIKSIFCVGLAFCMFSCNQDEIYKEKRTFDDYSWKKNEILTFESKISQEQTGKNYNLVFSIRYITGFSLKYLNFVLTIRRPDGSQASKDIGIQIISDDNVYRGEGIGDIWDLEYKLSEPIYFSMPGKYTFTLNPIIEGPSVNFISKLGISIINTKE